LDTTLLRILKFRERYERLHKAVPENGVDEKTKAILKDMGAYFASNPGAKVIEPGPFKTFFALQHPKLTAEKLSTYGAAIREIGKEAEPGTEDGILSRLVEVTTASKLQAALQGFEDGETDLTAALRQIADSHEEWFLRRKQHPKVKDRIEDILDEEENDTGFHWRLDALNRSMRPLRGGDFGIIGARVDSGKTSVLASELTFFAPQVDLIYPGQDRTIIVLNNEGPGKRLKQRMFNAALKRTTTKLIELKQAGIIYDEYLKALGGRDLIHVFDVHDYSMSELEDIVKEMDPAIVVIDMLDNVRMDSLANNGGTRTDQLLEAMYQRARIWAVKYDCVVLATTQLNGDAEGETFPTMAMLANSRTGKPGAADFIYMLGRSKDEMLQGSRWVSLPKNKKRRDGGPQDPRKEVVFDGPRALILDPEEE
jgi:replicative DNA helicase